MKFVFWNSRYLFIFCLEVYFGSKILSCSCGSLIKSSLVTVQLKLEVTFLVSKIETQSHDVYIFTYELDPGGCTPVYWTIGCAAYMGGSAEGKSSRNGLNFGKCTSKTGFNVTKYFVIYIY